MAKYKKQGPFGTIHTEYSRKGQKAINYLLKVKEGEVPNALYHKEIGWIDVVWSYAGTAKSDGFGLSKIVKYHKSIVPELQLILKRMKVTFISEGRYKMENDKYMFAVSRFYYGKQKKWLLTAYEKET